MKKPKIIKIAVTCIFTAILFLSCKSTPDMAAVDPFELLDSDAALYMTLPVQSNQDFVISAIQKVSSVSENDAKKIAERLDIAYIALASNGEIQFSASGKLPTSFLGMAFSEKNGWSSSIISGQVCYTNKKNKYQLSIPSSSNVFMSRNINPMVKRYNRLAYANYPLEELTAEEQSSMNLNEKLISESMLPGNYKFLHESQTGDILVFSPKPQILIKTPLDSAFAVFSQFRGVKNQFNVRLVLNLKDKRTVLATCALLKTTLFGIPAKITQTGEAQITITDLPLSTERVLSFIR